MAVTVVGSVAFDAVETPFGRRERILGGAATHFALAASFFTDVRVVGVVGDDFGAEEFAVFQSRGINVEDVEQIAGVQSFFWAGRYDSDMQVAQTIDTQLNVFAGFDPVLSSGARASRVTFLANIQPDLQRRVREQCSGAVVTGLDSMNYWIESARESLLETIACVDVVSLNDTEVRMLTGQPNLARAARQICALGPRVLVVEAGQLRRLHVHGRAASSSSRAIRSRPSSTPRARETRSPAASSAISTPISSRGRSPTRFSGAQPCSARSSRRSRSRPSAASDCRR